MSAHSMGLALPWRVTLAAAVLLACAWLPISVGQDGTLAGLLLAAWREDWLQGLLATLVLGGPHLFAATAMVASRAPDGAAPAWVRALTAWLMVELVLLALIVLHGLQEGQGGRAPLALIGFAAVLASAWWRRMASPHTPMHRRDVGASVRFGAMACFGAFAWFELQVRGGQGPGLWLHATTAASFLLVAVVPRDR
ncbi:MAG: hypothetical protein IPK74_22800 [Deltaproteobacteria bacterium]|nr:hypothetical protein [Deltaproteobacteria bacterium]